MLRRKLLKSYRNYGKLKIEKRVWRGFRVEFSNPLIEIALEKLNPVKINALFVYRSTSTNIRKLCI